MAHTQTASSADPLRASLSTALTFHASFDHGADADFALGDKQIYSSTDQDVQNTATHTPGLGSPALAIAEGQGKFGAALAFTQANSHVVLYKGDQNITYNQSAFGSRAVLLNADN